jgi:hypothetical protein
MVPRVLATRLVRKSTSTQCARHFSAKLGDNWRTHNWIEDVSLDTQLVHGGVVPCEKTGAILTPVYLSTTFVQESVDQYLEKGYSYSRTNNPTVSMLEEKVSLIENGYG